jgi:hypothetical protein
MRSEGHTKCVTFLQKCFGMLAKAQKQDDTIPALFGIGSKCISDLRNTLTMASLPVPCSCITALKNSVYSSVPLAGTHTKARAGKIIYYR